MKFWLKCVLVVFVGLIIIAGFFKVLAGKLIYNLTVKNIPELTNTTIDLKSVNVCFLKGRVSFNELAISDSADSSAKTILFVKKLRINIGLFSLLKGNPLFQEIFFHHPIINIEHPRFNEIFSCLTGAIETKNAEEIKNISSPLSIPLTIEKIILKKGKLVFNDYPDEKQSLLINNLDCLVKNINVKNSGVKFSLKGEFPSSPKGNIFCKGEFLTVDQKVNLTGEIQAKNIFLPYFNSFFEPNCNFNIKNGILQLHSIIQCQNDWVVSSNLVTLENLHISFGDGMTKTQKIFGLPVKIVTDFFKTDKISFNLPISGDIRDPQFGFSTAISQMLLKAFKDKFKDSTAKTLSVKMGRKIGGKIDNLFREIFYLKK
ncbi:DUF748 domain-containing protein [bacterium]|nr:DUF748 domain-containing protein [bacterium]